MGGLPRFEAATSTRSAMLTSDDLAQSNGGGVWGVSPHSRLRLSPDLQCCPWTKWQRAAEWGFGGSPTIRGYDFHPIYNVALRQNGPQCPQHFCPQTTMAQSEGGGVWGVYPHSRLQLSPDLQRCPWTTLPRATEGGFTRFAILPLDDVAQSDRGGLGGGLSPHIRGCDFHQI